MPEEFLRDRKKALEDTFFAKQNAKLVERLRSEREKKTAREKLAQISGLSDDEVLDKLIALDIGADTWAALSLVPLVEVAWADGKVEEKERRAVLSAAETNGMDRGSPSLQLLESWLAHRPDGRLLEAWGEYIVGLCTQLSAAEKNALEAEILGRARAVAEAAGGLLGLGNKISPEEEVVLSQLEKAFQG